jgi:hypothetical protein
LSGSHRLAVYYDNSAPQWGEMLFQEKKIYEKHNIRIGGYLFDEGFGVDSKSIKALVGQKRYPVTYNRKKHLLRVKIPRKDLTKGFHRLRIWAEDRAGNPAKKIDKYFIIRYKPKWGTAY